MYYKARKGRHGTAFKPTVQPTFIPPSVGGINALDAIAGMPPEDCLYTYNLAPSEYGVRLRKGYREWANGLPSQANTLIGYEGSAQDGSEDRLWAVCAEGIYDVTLFNTTSPVQDVAFAINVTGEAGYGVWTEFVNTADDTFLFYADAENGLHMYTESTQTWSVPAITGASPSDICYVLNWKNRLWFIEQNSGVGWYLDVDAISGAATQFTFGSQFRHGGGLRALFSWTIDGGDGIDDYLIAVGRAGDVLVYAGTDPSAADFGLKGSYYIGDVPGGRRFGLNYGGELYLLSVFGISSLRDLLSGVTVDNIFKQGTSAKVNRFLRDDMLANRDDFSWALSVDHSDGRLMVVTPYEQTDNAVQYVQNLLTRAWGMWQSVPINCCTPWDGEFYFAGKEGSVWLYDNDLDGTLLDGTLGVDVEYSILTSFQPLGAIHGINKMVSTIRAQGILGGSTSASISAVWDYDFNAYLPQPAGGVTYARSLWDAAVWDIDVWDFARNPADFLVGAAGYGKAVAIGMRGSANSRLTLTGWDIVWKQGGLL